MSSNTTYSTLVINQAMREAQKQQQAFCIWLTGLSGAGKSTIATHLDQALYTLGRHAYTIDGDNIRSHLNSDLGFSEADRQENIRRISEISKLMFDAGLIAIVACISPYTRERDFARSLFPPGKFIEVYVNTPIAVCEQRDPKGLYAKARSGQLQNFTGISAPYEKPSHPELLINTEVISAEQAVDLILEKMS